MGMAYLGYLTAENSEHSGCTRMSRSKTKQSKVVRASRSLSKSKLPNTQLLFDNYKTPINKAPKNDYGFVTPKVTIVFGKQSKNI